MDRRTVSGDTRTRLGPYRRGVTTPDNARRAASSFVDLLEYEMTRQDGDTAVNPALAGLADLLARDPTAVLGGVTVVARDLVRQIVELEGWRCPRCSGGFASGPCSRSASAGPVVPPPVPEQPQPGEQGKGGEQERHASGARM